MGTIVLSIKNIEYITSITAEYQVVKILRTLIFITVFALFTSAISSVIVTIYDKTAAIKLPKEDVRRKGEAAVSIPH